MIKQKNIGAGSGRGVHEFHPERPLLTVPKVNPVPRKIDGVKMYVGVGRDKGRLFIQEAFDRMFKVVRTPIKRRSYKGERLDVLLNQF